MVIRYLFKCFVLCLGHGHWNMNINFDRITKILIPYCSSLSHLYGFSSVSLPLQKCLWCSQTASYYPSYLFVEVQEMIHNRWDGRFTFTTWHKCFKLKNTYIMCTITMPECNYIQIIHNILDNNKNLILPKILKGCEWKNEPNKIEQ